MRDQEIRITAKDATQSAFRSVQDRLRDLGGAAATTAGSLRGIAAAGGIGAVFAGVAAGGAMVAGLVRDMGDLDDAAQRTGASVESLSSLLNTLKPTGVGLEQITDLAGKLTRSMSAAEDQTKGTGAAFSALGVATRDAEGNLRPIDDVLVDLAQSLAMYRDDANKVAIVQRALGDEGAKYLPVLKDLAQLQREAANVTTEQAQAAADLQDDIGRLAVEYDKLKVEILGGVIPALARLAGEFNQARSMGLGFWDALQTIPGPGADKVSQLEASAKRISDLQGRIGRLEPIVAKGGSAFNNDVDLARLREQLAAEQKIYDVLYAQGRKQGLFLTQKEMEKGGDRYGPTPEAPSVNLPRTGNGGGGGKGSGKSGRGGASSFEDFATKVNQDVSRLLEGTSIAKVRELEAVLTRLDELGKAGLDSGIYGQAVVETLENLAKAGVSATDVLADLDERFFSGQLKISGEQYDALIEKIFRTTERGGSDGEKALRELADRWKDLIDPTRDHLRQLDEIRRLYDAGALTKPEAESAISLVRKEIDGTLIGTQAETEKAADFARDLGLTFTSAFEEAVAAGANLRDVLSGLEADLMRLMTRKMVTEPLGQWFEQLLGSGGGTDLFSQAGAWISRAITGPAPIVASVPVIQNALGGVVSADGAMPLRRYAAGGVAYSPQLAMFGEGSMPEAYVPLPDGRSIPVTVAGGGGDTHVHLHGVSDFESFRRSEGQLKARVSGWSAGAGRFR